MHRTALAALAAMGAGRQVVAVAGTHGKTTTSALVATVLVEAGRHGQKTGAGWYHYPPGSRTPVPDPGVTAFIEKFRAAKGITPRKVTDQEIVQRCIYALINEGARIVEEGIAQRSSDVDIVYLNGYGFPAWRGGPMCYADSVGLRHVLGRITEFEKRHGPELWSPAPLLQRMAEAGQTFESFDARFAK